MEIVITGIGRVGLVTACCLADAGHSVTGIEINENRLDQLNAGVNPFHEEGISTLLKKGLSGGNLRLLSMWPAKMDTDIVIITVNTPTLNDGSSDLSHIYEVIDQVRQSFSNRTILVMKSTVPPGTGDRLRKGPLGNSGFKYVSNPEFLRTGQGVYDWYHQSRIVIGAADSWAADKVRELYEGIEAPIVMTDITSAEMIKCASNSFLATKVSFINEIANICELVGADIDGVIRGLGFDPRIGPSYLQPGPGYGGPCLPKDARALEYLASSRDYSFTVLKGVIEANYKQQAIIVNKVIKALGNLKGKEVAVLGLAFKAGTDDIAEAPAIAIVNQLARRKANIRVYDPAAMQNAGTVLPDGVIFAPDLRTAVTGAQATILLTEWPEFINADWGTIKNWMVAPYIVLDCRNILVKNKLVKAGFDYSGIGR